MSGALSVTHPAPHRLIALWALAETMLGGILHAFNIPLTGYLVGGMAILCIGMLAHFHPNSSRIILRALLLVLILKAMVSPHSPPMAYIAVAFQGIMGAFIFGFFGFRWWTCILFSVLALIESGFQKLIIMTLIYGMELWKALDGFGEGLARSFSIQIPQDFSLLLILAYLSTYVVWGLFLGRFLWKLPKRLQSRISRVSEWDTLAPETAGMNKKNKHVRWLILATILSLLVIIMFQSGNTRGALYLVIRALIMTIVLFGLIQPLLTKAIQAWMTKKNTHYKEEIQQINAHLMQLGRLAGPMYRLCRSEIKGWRAPFEFIIRMFILAIYARERNSDLQ